MRNGDPGAASRRCSFSCFYRAPASDSVVCVGAIFSFVIFVFVFVIFAIVKSMNASGRNRLAQSGLRGRGLVLASTQMATNTRMGMQRFEQRQMTLEIEVQGVAPYVIQGTFLIPRGVVDAIPGSSLEVAVDRANPSSVVVLGPGGFTGPWLNSGPPQPF